MKLLSISRTVLSTLAVGTLLLGQLPSTLAAEPAENMPFTDEVVELDFWVGKGPQNGAVDWNEMPFWQEYADMTNVEINWNQVTADAVAEQRNLTLVSGELPDVFYSAGFSNSDVFRYGQQGVFVQLNDLIEENMPNFTKLMEENPEIRDSITFPDGNIYSVPYVFSSEFTSLRVGPMPYVNLNALEATEAEMPTTTDELYEFLTDIKENDFAGDGKTVPLSAPDITYIERFLAGSFGVRNMGGANGPVDYNHDTGDLRFYGTSDEYKEMLQYMNKLYSEGLIDNSIYTMEWGNFVANKEEGIYGLHVFWGPDVIEEDEFYAEYDVLVPVAGPNGDQQYLDYLPMINGLGSFLVTSANENTALSLQWLDYFFSDEGATMYYLGEEGATYEVVDGQAQYLPEINAEVVQHLPWLGNNQGVVKKDSFIGGESAPKTIEVAKKFEPYIEEPWSTFTYTIDENDFMVSMGTEIDKYYEEMRDRFITGDASFDEWDSYVSTLESMPLEEYMTIKQTAYDRMYGE